MNAQQIAQQKAIRALYQTLASLATKHADSTALGQEAAKAVKSAGFKSIRHISAAAFVLMEEHERINASVARAIESIPGDLLPNDHLPARTREAMGRTARRLVDEVRQGQAKK